MTTDIIYCEGSLPQPCVGLFAGGSHSTPINVIDAIDFASTGVYRDFGDLYQSVGYIASCSDGTIGLFGGGLTSTSTRISLVTYVEISTSSNSATWGDLTEGRFALCACSNPTVALFAGGQNDASSAVQTIDQLLFASLSNSTVFGQLSVENEDLSACSDPSTAVFNGGDEYRGWVSNLMEEVQFDSAGNATSFGTLSGERHMHTSSSDDNVGLIGGGIGYFYDNSNPPYYNVMNHFTFNTKVVSADYGYLSMENGTTYPASCGDGISCLWGGGDFGDYLTNIEKSVFSIGGIASSFGNLSEGREGIGACSGGSVFGCVYYMASPIALWGGGWNTAPLEDQNTIEKTSFDSDVKAQNYGSCSGTQGTGGASDGNYVYWFAGFGNEINDYVWMDYVEKSSLSYEASATSWGVMMSALVQNAGCANNVQLLISGGKGDDPVPDSTYIQKKYTASDVDMAYFGDLMYGPLWMHSSTNNATTALIAGGETTGGAETDLIQQVQFESDSTSYSFGTLQDRGNQYGAVSDETTAVFAGGWGAGDYDYGEQIWSVQYASGGNTSFFGNIVGEYLGDEMVGAGNGTQGCFGSGWHVKAIDRITIASASNATTIGELSTERYECGAGGGYSNVFITSDHYLTSDGRYKTPAYFGDTGMCGAGIHNGIGVEQYEIVSDGVVSWFGSLNNAQYQNGSCSDGTQMIWMGGEGNGNYDEVQIKRIQKMLFCVGGLATDFGSIDLDTRFTQCASDGIRGLMIGGNADIGPGFTRPNVNVERVWFASGGNTSSWGWMGQSRASHACASDGTYALAAGGVDYDYAKVYSIQILTFASSGTDSTFSNLTNDQQENRGVSDGTTALFSGGVTDGDFTTRIETVEFASQVDATVYGNLSLERGDHGSCNNTSTALFIGGECESVPYTNTVEKTVFSSGGTMSSWGNMASTYGDFYLNADSGGGFEFVSSTPCDNEPMFTLYTHITMKAIEFDTYMDNIELFEVKEPSSINMEGITVQSNIDASVDGTGKLMIDSLTIHALKPVNFTDITTINATGITVFINSENIANGGGVLRISNSDAPELEATINIDIDTGNENTTYPVLIENSFVGKLAVTSIADYYGV